MVLSEKPDAGPRRYRIPNVDPVCRQGGTRTGSTFAGSGSTQLVAIRHLLRNSLRIGTGNFFV